MKKMIRLMASVLCLAVILCGTALASSGYTYTTGKLNMRATPDLDGTIRGSIPSGTEVYYEDSSYDSRGVEWLYVYYNGKYGWISSQYTTDKDYSYSGYTQSEQIANQGYITMTGKINLRRNASISSSVITTVPKNTRLYYTDYTFDERNIRWFYVSYDGYHGWVSSKYTEEYGQWEGGHSGSAGTIVMTGKANIRSQPDKESTSLGTIPDGATASYAGSKECDSRGVYWYKITYNGTTGWVSEKYAYLR